MENIILKRVELKTIRGLIEEKCNQGESQLKGGLEKMVTVAMKA